MKFLLRLDVILGLVFLISFFIPMLWPAYPFVLEQGQAISNLSACVTWKESIGAAYLALLLFDLLTPFYWVRRVQLDKINLGLGHFIGALSLSLFGVLLLCFGLPLADVDGGAVALSKLYCNSVIGSFLILSCIGFSVALFFSYFLLVVKCFLLGKWR